MSRPAAPKPPLTDAQRELVAKNYPLARYAARKLWRRINDGILLEDLEGAAVGAMIAAARRFDATRGVSFGTYCWRGMFRRMQQHVDREFRRRRSFRELPFSQADGLEEDDDWQPAESREPDAERRVFAADGLERVRKQLHPHWFQILVWRFQEGRKLREIGAMAQLSQQRIVQIIDNSLARVRAKLTREAML